MFGRRLVVLTLMTVVVVTAATIFAGLRTPQTAKQKVAFFPDLADRIESVNRISIQGRDESIHLTRTDHVWGIDEFDGYPALAEKVKGTVLGAADLKIRAAKTALPRLYHRLGVEGLEEEGTTSLLLTLKGGDEANLVSVIVGKSRRSSAAQNSPGLYVRKPDEAQSWLVDGVLDISATKTDWIKRSLFDIPSETIERVRIKHADGDTFTLYKSEAGQEDFVLENLPAGKKIASKFMISRFGSLMQDMQIRGARAEKLLAVGDDAVSFHVVTFQGVIADGMAFEVEGIPYASFAFSYHENSENADKVKQTEAYVGDLNQRVSGWWFEIPEFKYDLIKKRFDDVIQDETGSVQEG